MIIPIPKNYYQNSERDDILGGEGKHTAVTFVPWYSVLTQISLRTSQSWFLQNPKVFRNFLVAIDLLRFFSTCSQTLLKLRNKTFLSRQLWAQSTQMLPYSVQQRSMHKTSCLILWAQGSFSCPCLTSPLPCPRFSQLLLWSPSNKEVTALCPREDVSPHGASYSGSAASWYFQQWFHIRHPTL